MKLERLFFLPELGVLLLFVTLFVVYFYAAFADPRRERNRGALVAAVAFSALQLANLAILLSVLNLRHGTAETVWNQVPAARTTRLFFLVEAMLAVLFFFATVRASVLCKRARKTLTRNSVMEAIMNLPSGICFAGADGRVILSNTLIRRQILRLTGKPLTDANEAWSGLCRAAEETEPAHVEQLFCRTEDRVWSFRRKELLIDGRAYCQIDCDDVTERFRLMEELRVVTKKAEQQNRRTRELLADIVHTRSEQEILDMQSRIHHEVGQCVILARRYLEEAPDPERLAQLLDLWEQTFRFSPSAKEAQDSGEQERELCMAAELCGCRVRFCGDRPQSDADYLLYLAAVREAVTNAIRHAGATEICVVGTRRGQELSVVISDNSTLRVGHLTEGVGLGVLRKKLEAAGVRLDIETGDGVRLILSFPKETIP